MPGVWNCPQAHPRDLINMFDHLSDGPLDLVRGYLYGVTLWWMHKKLELWGHSYEKWNVDSVFEIYCIHTFLEPLLIDSYGLTSCCHICTLYIFCHFFVFINCIGVSLHH